MVEEMDDDFKKWILAKVASTPPREMVEDTGFSCRLLNDVLHGRSKKFNKSGKADGSGSSGIDLLRREYNSEVKGGLNAENDM